MKCPECESDTLSDGTFGKQQCSECHSEYKVASDGVKPMGRNRIYDPPYKMKHKGAKFAAGIKPIEVIPPVVNFNQCIVCDGVLQATFGSVRARILKGYSEMMVEGKHIDPTTGRGMVMTRSFPTFQTGRVCLKCQATMEITSPYVNKKGEITANPRERNEIEILQERVTLRTVTVVTKRLVELEDAALEQELKDVVVYTTPSKKHPRLRVRQPAPFVPPSKDEVELDKANNHHLKGKLTDINVQGFKKYGGGSRGGLKSYDIEVNFANQKKGHK